MTAAIACGACAPWPASCRTVLPCLHACSAPLPLQCPLACSVPFPAVLPCLQCSPADALRYWQMRPLQVRLDVAQPLPDQPVLLVLEALTDSSLWGLQTHNADINHQILTTMQVAWQHQPCW